MNSPGNWFAPVSKTNHRFFSRNKGDEDIHKNLNHGEKTGHERISEGIKDCAYLICKGAGWRLVETLKGNGIKVVFSEEKDAMTAATKFEKGELTIFEEGSCCS